MSRTPPVDIDLLDEGLYVAGPPHEVFRRLRSEAPVFRADRGPGRPPFWAVTRYDDVVRVSRDPVFSSARNGAFLDEEPGGPNESLVNLDPPAHTGYRAVVAPSFTAAAVDRLERRVRRHCTLVLDRVTEAGECDFARDVAAELSLATLAELLGFPDEEDRQLVGRLTRVLGDPAEAAFPDATTRAVRRLFGFAHELAGWRRQDPRDDLVTRLAGARVPVRDPAGDERLTDRQFELFFLLLATAGHLTTQYLMSGAVLALLENPVQWYRLQADPGLLETGLDEMLRWVSPVVQFQRTALEGTEIGGQPVATGERVVMYYSSANRDERVFADPDRFDVTRDARRQLSFGAGGPHFCLGSRLARLETRVLLEAVIERMPDLTLAGPAENLGSTFVNGLRSLPVSFTPSPARLSRRA